MLNGTEPNPTKRKALAISLLKELEEEKGHDVVKIGEALDEEGKAGLLKRLKKRKKKIAEEEPEYWEEALEMGVQAS